MTIQQKISAAQTAAKNIRRRIVEMAYTTGKTGAHLGGSLSLVEIMAVLYGGAMSFSSKNPSDPTRDRLILSKGHGVPAQYAALRELGVLDDADIVAFKTDGAKLSAHPVKNQQIGIEFSSGSLGMGLSLAAGTAIALKKLGNQTSRAITIIGDGECDEGQIWEAALACSHFKLDNVLAIIDANGLQYDGLTDDIMDIAPLEQKWRAFGFDTDEIDGHNIPKLFDAIQKRCGKPRAIIAKTVKGKGLSFAENNAQWHNGILTDVLYQKALEELEVQNG